MCVRKDGVILQEIINLNELINQSLHLLLCLLSLLCTEHIIFGAICTNVLLRKPGSWFVDLALHVYES